MPLVTAGSVSLTTSVEVILMIHQRSCHGKNKNIHSQPEIDLHKNKVDDRSTKLGGNQHTITLDKHKIHMPIRNLLSYTPLRPHADVGQKKLPHVILASDKDWDPKVLDYEVQVDNERGFDAQ